ncbi:MAG TPA: glycosyltransferase family 39 protein [Pirellulaceae bacterium]|nr:glycosyltransferase family 39 protein [Pirellulaceae bacterium]HMO92444.1 glycosyltransferase family 39 protein [Pirellulaceae bacterium]HMP67886.1 glycosyltransferase family 39 protein [Pirellulaceae bacterium]
MFLGQHSSLPSSQESPHDGRPRFLTSDACWWFILGASLILFMSSLGATKLWDEDEGFYASTAAEMYRNGEWVVPTFNGELFAHKPPFMYWMMMLGYSIFGVSEIGARFFSSIFAVATILMTYLLGTRLFNARAGVLSAIVLATSLLFSIGGRAATPDVYLTFFVTTAIYCFVRLREANQTADASRSVVTHADQRSAKWSLLFLMYIAIACATLCKGPIGILFPATIIGCYLIWAAMRRSNRTMHSLDEEDIGRWRSSVGRNLLRSVLGLRPITGLLIVFAVAGPWYVGVGALTEGEFHREFFGVHHWHRASTAMEGHRGPVFYYPISVLVGMFPWSIITIPAIIIWWRSFKDTQINLNGLRLVTCWILVYIIVFSMAATKLPTYILPAYPAMALCFGLALDVWLSKPVSFPVHWHRIAFSILILLGFSFVIGFPILATWKFAGQTLLDKVGLAQPIQAGFGWLGLLGLPSLIGGIAAFYFADRRSIQKAIAVCGVTGVLTLFGLWNFAASWIDQFQGPQVVVERLRTADPTEEMQLATYGFFRPSMVFYNRNVVQRFWEINDVHEYFATNEPKYLIIEARVLPEIEDRIPNQMAVVQRRARFPEKGELVLLTNRVASQTASPSPNQRNPRTMERAMEMKQVATTRSD